MSTKKLAKELGLLRKRNQPSTGKRISPFSSQIFSHLIVIDFESTCWREKNNYGQEIIEFPAVLLNTSTGEIDSEFHSYVQPQEHPVLSEFCTELTGITQRQVEAGVPLHICLSQFSRWLQALQLQKGFTFPGEQRSSTSSASQKPCAFLTWSDWDLGVCLQYECKRKQLHKPDVLNSWIDLRATYRVFYNRKPKGLNGALQDLGIQFSGREHSGLDDARNTAQLTLRMMRDGCVIKLTRTQERAPLTVKPMFGNAKDHASCKEKKEKEENTICKEKTSFHLQSCSKNNVLLSDTKEKVNPIQETFQEYKSLVSPRTLLNGTTTPVLGKGTTELVNTDLFSTILKNAPSPHGNSNRLVLCSTTVGCVSHLPQVQLTFEPEAAVLGHPREDIESDIMVGIEEWCGSSDYVVLDGDDDAADLNVMVDTEDTSNKGRSLSNVPRCRNSFSDQINVFPKHNSTKTVCIERKGEKTTLELRCSSNTFTTPKRSQSFVPTNYVRHHPNVSLPNTSASTSNTISNHPGGVASALCLQFQDKSQAPHNNSKTWNSFLIGPKKCVADKISVTSNMFVKPKPVIIQHNTRLSKKSIENAKNSFIYSDTAEPKKRSPCQPTVSLRTPQRVMPPLPGKLSSSRSCQFTTRHSSLLQTSGLGLPRITAPMCACGRRAKRQTVCNGGPNHGRGFYCCPVRRSGAGNMVQKSCKFFKWESALIKDNSPANSFVRSSLNVRCRQQSLRKSY